MATMETCSVFAESSTEYVLSFLKFGFGDESHTSHFLYDSVNTASRRYIEVAHNKSAQGFLQTVRVQAAGLCRGVSMCVLGRAAKRVKAKLHSNHVTSKRGPSGSEHFLTNYLPKPKSILWITCFVETHWGPSLIVSSIGLLIRPLRLR